MFFSTYEYIVFAITEVTINKINKNKNIYFVLSQSIFILLKSDTMFKRMYHLKIFVYRKHITLILYSLQPSNCRSREIIL